jgi:hypothetical protein
MARASLAKKYLDNDPYRHHEHGNFYKAQDGCACHIAMATLRSHHHAQSTERKQQ